MRKFFAPNIDWRGRVVRTMYGLAMIVVGLLVRKHSWWASALLVLAGGFGLYEAVRGWCLMRACGIKTRL